jgi:hypothetical protein
MVIFQTLTLMSARDNVPVPSISALVAVGLYFGEKIVDLGERGAAPTAGVMAESEKTHKQIRHSSEKSHPHVQLFTAIVFIQYIV